MSKNKKKKKSSGHPKPIVRLSLCMIVKNEEKNIEKALGWAKSVVYEIIVVDTGSTDKTVEMAKKMGAKVYHFEWINDFSAARNFAIDNATGNWILIIDADEYFEVADAKKLVLFLKEIQSNPESREKYLGVGCGFYNLDDAGNFTTSGDQLRAFRNLPFLRYTGKIHEKVTIDKDNTVILDGVMAYHTGYSETVMRDKNKIGRNVELLRPELEKNPDDLNLKAYLADALRLKADPKSIKEAEQLFTDVINSGVDADVHKELKHKAFIYYASKYANDPAKLFECEDICNRALVEFPGNLDFEYFIALVLNKKGEFEKARTLLESSKAKLSDEKAVNASYYVSVNPDLLQQQITIANIALQASAAPQSSAAPQASAVPQSPALEQKLSFNMIVKNGEKTIGKALESVKDIAFERIVVDTGSTDRTVGIAEEMGAKVYYFEWINDFAAARNCAIEHTTGDWVLSLDADEYFLPEDAQKISDLYKQIQSEPEKWSNCYAVSFMGINLDDNGRAMTKWRTIHMFRNIPSIRYKGRIHETLTIDDNEIINRDDINLYHTGYSETTHKETGKSLRNIELLRAELEREPDNLNKMAYLASALNINDDEKSQAEAEELYKVILSKQTSQTVHKWQRIKTYIYFINKYLKDPDRLKDCEGVCRKALDDFPGAVDFEYFLASVYSLMGKNDEAWELLKSCETNVVNGVNLEDSIVIPADPITLFCKMIIVAKALGDIENVVLYSTHVLTMDKTRKSILGPCIATLLHYGVSEAETIELLSNIYDMRDTDDLRFVAETAGEYGATDFAEGITKLSGDKGE